MSYSLLLYRVLKMRKKKNGLFGDSGYFGGFALFVV